MVIVCLLQNGNSDSVNGGNATSVVIDLVNKGGGGDESDGCQFSGDSNDDDGNGSVVNGCVDGG